MDNHLLIRIRKILEKIEEKVHHPTKEEKIETKTLPDVYARRNEGNIGMLHVKDKNTREEILNKLKDTEAVKKIERTKDILDNPPEDFPDLVFILEEGYGFHTEKGSPYITTNAPNILNHDMEGIIIAYGPDVKKGKSENAKIIDISPTILSFFNLAQTAEMKGNVLDIFNKEETSQPQQDKKDSLPKETLKEKNPDNYSEEDEEIIKERLKKLGYI